MFQRSHTVVAAAAVALLSGGVILMGQNTPQGGERQPANEPAPAGQAGAPAGQANEQSGMQANHQIIADLRQFAQDPKTASDKKFVLDSYLGSTMEVAMSQQALGKTQDNQVKDLANHLIADHTKLNQQLQQLAQQLNVDLPQGMPSMKQAELDLMGSFSGKDYDQAYLSALNADHAKDIACFQCAAANAQNAQVKQLAQQTEPTLKQHHQMVKQVASATGVNLGEAEATPAGAHMVAPDEMRK